MDEVTKEKLIELIKDGRISRGTTFKDIAKYLNIPIDGVFEVVLQLKPMYVNGIRVPGIRRVRPELCEVCAGNNQLNNLLVYHHWNNSNLSQGVWVCSPCHQICELTDGYHGDRPDLQSKYLKLKESIDKVIL